MKTQLSPKEFGRAVGVSESTVKRWVDDGAIAASRTAGGHRRIPLASAVAFIRERGLRVANPHVLGLAELGAAPGEAEPGTALADALLAGRSAEARGLIQSLYLTGDSVAAVCDGPIAGAMEHIGTLWRHGETGIFLEHRATEICHQALDQLRLLLPTPPAGAPVAIGGGPAGDAHELGSLMVATVLAAEGWRDINLGAEVPTPVLIDAAADAGAALVWWTVTTAQPAARLVREATALADALRAAGRTLAIGGRAWPASARLTADNVYIGRSMAELAAFASGLAKAVA